MDTKIERPGIRVRVSAKYESSQKGFVPDVTVELVCPAQDYQTAHIADGVGRITFDTYVEVTDKVIEYLKGSGLPVAVASVSE